MSDKPSALFKDRFSNPLKHLKKSARLLLATLAAFLICLPAFSQGVQGTIQGGVFDQSGGAIAGAAVTVTDVARGVTRSFSVADGAGQYVATNPQPGLIHGGGSVQGLQNGRAERSDGGSRANDSRRPEVAARRTKPDSYGYVGCAGGRHIWTLL